MNTNTKNLILISIYVATFFVLSLFSIDFIGLKLTIQNLPLFLGAISLGPIAGGFIGFLGMLLNQMVTYGFSVTTFIWVLPHTIIGILMGFAFRSKVLKFYQPLRLCVAIVLFQILLTTLNTVAFCIDSLIYGYYTFLTIFGSYVLRLMVGVLTSIIYMITVPFLIKLQKKIH